jgi:hypothetical protein
MTLYRNGIADAYIAFNETVHVYSDDISTRSDEQSQFIIFLSCVLFGLIVCFFLFIVGPVFIRVNRERANYWQEIMTQMQKNHVNIK